jgi:hypothetical protein
MSFHPKHVVAGGSAFSIPVTELHSRSNSIDDMPSWWVSTRQLFGFRERRDYISWPGPGILLSVDAAMRIAEDTEDYLFMAELSKYQRKHAAVCQ